MAFPFAALALAIPGIIGAFKKKPKVPEFQTSPETQSIIDLLSRALGGGQVLSDERLGQIGDFFARKEKGAQSQLQTGFIKRGIKGSGAEFNTRTLLSSTFGEAENRAISGERNLEINRLLSALGAFGNLDAARSGVGFQRFGIEEGRRGQEFGELSQLLESLGLMFGGGGGGGGSNPLERLQLIGGSSGFEE